MFPQEWGHVYFIALRKMRCIEILDNSINHIIITIPQRPDFGNFSLASSLLCRENRSESEQKNIPVDLKLCAWQW